MIDENELIIGNYYFKISYSTENKDIPEIRTYIYIGKNIFFDGDDNSNPDEWIFQEAESYLKDGPFIRKGKVSHKKIMLFDRSALFLIHDLDGLIAYLNELKSSLSK